MNSVDKLILKGFKIAIPAIAVVVLLFLSLYQVETGEVGVVSRFGKVSSVVREGLHLKIPFIETVDKVETREITYNFVKGDTRDDSLTVSTEDLQTINVELTVQAGIEDPELLYRSFKNDHVNRFIRPRVLEISQATISKYTIEEFVQKRQEISSNIYATLKEDFKKYGLTVSNISIVNHDFSDEYEKAIEQKKVAEQAVETEKAKQEKLVIEATNRVKLAQLQLEQKELEAKANLVESSSLTPQLLQKKAIEKWNGELPKVSNSGSNIIDLNKL